MARGNPEYLGKPPEAVRAFQAQRTSANRRGIPFLFTFTEWWEWWQTDNRWANRGMGKGKFVMARRGDQGPYSPENVYCATHSQNATDGNLLRDMSEEVRRQWRVKPKPRRAGAEHYKSQAIQTPAGRFANATEAAKHFGLTRQGIHYRVKAGVDGWGYAKLGRKTHGRH